MIARVGEAGEKPSGDGAAAKREPEAAWRRRRRPRTLRSGTAEAPAQAPAEPAGPTPSGDGRVKASPLARRMASEKGLDLAALSGSGPGGRIVKADVERAMAAGPAPAAAPARRGARRPRPPSRPRERASARRRPRERYRRRS